jgi:hypothetical protein
MQDHTRIQIVRDASDSVVSSPPVSWAVNKLREAISEHSVSISVSDNGVSEVSDSEESTIVYLSGPESSDRVSDRSPPRRIG